MSDFAVNGVSSSGLTGANAADPVIDNPGARLDKDAFLKLLVAQLRYQDPSQPLDANQMIAQTSQLETVERLNEISEALSASNASNRLATASSLIGKSITFTPPDGVVSVARVESARIDGDTIIVTAGGFDVPSHSISSISSTDPIPVARGST